MKTDRPAQGAPYAMILFLIFLVLKLTDHINWSWWWITSPLWIAVAIVLIVFGVLVLVDWRRDRERRRKVAALKKSRGTIEVL